MKANNKQEAVISRLIMALRYMSSSRDISSPTHICDFRSSMDGDDEFTNDEQNDIEAMFVHVFKTINDLK